MTLHALRNPVKHYAWGSRTAIPELLGEPTPADEPWAELWVGAHSRGSSEIYDGDCWRSLREWIAEDPARALGRTRSDSAGELPFLLKILASEQPLSLQAHPDPAEARAGFEREESQGIALTAPHRSFPDPNPKPELVVALDRFEVLCGVRPIDEVSRAIEILDAPVVRDHFREVLAAGDSLEVLRRWLATPTELARVLTDAAGAAAGRGGLDDSGIAWIPRLATAHPRDIGILAPLFLTYRSLAPGEALFVGAGVLHGYLRGTALELQASSDNVLRGGLTGKHVDLPLLLDTLRPERQPEPSIPEPGSEGIREWPVETDRFSLRSVHLNGHTHPCTADRGAEILLCTEGHAEVGDAEGVLPLTPGAAVFVPGGGNAFWIRGDGTVYRASAA